MNFAQLALTPMRLGNQHAKLWRLFTELHADWTSLAPDGKNRSFGEVAITDLDTKSQSFETVFIGVRIHVQYIFSPWLEKEAERGVATVRYSLIDPSRPSDVPKVAGQFTYRTDGIASVSGYESEHLDFDEPNTAFQLLALMLRDSAQLER